ncbi:hypothetical protein ITI46_21385 [Streptomyces oryzae]|uniref:Uncharacterized protein n=1 Tax=Streptomyces oryzae TaxID=1434886 RepID=A0ABS3XFM5_9ACTN|nr:hypothetical protein [Streptomyces oryzae]MBO8194193.1 hypothetical protein [Streptomyces oryzae]
MPLRTLSTSRPDEPARVHGDESAPVHGMAATLVAVLTLLLALSALGSSQPAVDELGCPDGRAAATAAATNSCVRVAVHAPGEGRHPGHDPSSAQVCPGATATHRPLCHTLLPTVASPAVSCLLPGAATPAVAAPGNPPECCPLAAQRQILRC